MPNRKKIPDGRKCHIFMGVSAEFLLALDKVRVACDLPSSMSDGQVVKLLAQQKIAEILKTD